MTIDSFVDRFNSSKVWQVKRYSCGHYYWRQMIAGSLVNGGKWSRVSCEHMLNVIGG